MRIITLIRYIQVILELDLFLRGCLMKPEIIIRNFFKEVRSGSNPDFSNRYMADKVLAHQVISEEEQTVYDRQKIMLSM